MQIVYVAGDARRELDVRVNNPSATVADLVRESAATYAAQDAFTLSQTGMVRYWLRRREAMARLVERAVVPAK